MATFKITQNPPIQGRIRVIHSGWAQNGQNRVLGAAKNTLPCVENKVSRRQEVTSYRYSDRRQINRTEWRREDR